MPIYILAYAKKEKVLSFFSPLAHSPWKGGTGYLPITKHLQQECATVRIFLSTLF